MDESSPRQPFIEGQSQQELKRRLISLAKELSLNPEGFPFPGVSEETVEELRDVDAEYPGYTNPVDDVIARMKKGIKIVMGEDPESGNVFVLPFSSDDVTMDALLPRHFETIPEMNGSLRSLVLTQKALFESQQKEH